jgi:type I restriction enzyme S subunit
MSQWSTNQLSEVCEKITDGSHRTPPFTEYGYPFATVVHVDNDGKIDLSSCSRISAADFEDLRRNDCRPRQGDVLFSKDGTVGKVALIDFDTDFVVLSSLAILRPKRTLLNSHFLAYALRSTSALEQAVNRKSGSAIRRIVLRDLKHISIPIPPLIEQERMVKLLDEADALRKLRTQADRRTAELIPALFHEMFGDPVYNPRGWSIYPVSSFVDELHGGRNVNPAGADEELGRFRVLKISAVTWGEFDPEESKPVPAAYEPPPSHVVRPGDLLFSRANTTELVAATSYVFDSPSNLLLPDKLWRFVWKQPQTVEPFFVWWLLQAPSVRRELSRRATGTGGSMKNISKPKVMSLKVPLPPLSLQKEFADRVFEIRAVQTEQAASRSRGEDFYQSMLHRAFSGEL